MAFRGLSRGRRIHALSGLRRPVARFGVEDAVVGVVNDRREEGNMTGGDTYNWPLPSW
jgi:hypothetical protein